MIPPGLLTFASGLLATSVLIPGVVRFALRTGIIDFPGQRHVHTSPIPRIGGLAVFVGFHVACVVLFLFAWEYQGEVVNIRWWLKFLVCSTVVVLVGLIDDSKGLTPLQKLSGQTLAAALMFIADTRVGQLLGVPLPFLVDLTITLLWFIFITNAFNLIDGIDGLASGIAAIGALGLVGTLILRNLYFEAALVLGFIGACTGFLRYNHYPARVFLGDAGSNFIGFFLAAITIGTGSKGSAILCFWVPLLALSVPILDTVLAIWRRVTRRANAAIESSETQPGIMRGDLDHLHHRLMQAGIEPTNVTASLWLATAMLVFIGLVTFSFPHHAGKIFLATLVLLGAAVARFVPLIEVTESGALLRALGRSHSRFLEVACFAVLDLIGLCAALVVAIRLSHSQLPFVVVLNTWWNALPNWCGIPLCFAVLAEWYRTRTPLGTRVRLVVLTFGFGFGMLVNLAASMRFSHEDPEVLWIQTLLFFVLSYALSLCVRTLPALPETVADTAAPKLSSKST